MSFLSASILLFLVMDPFGNMPLFLCVLKEVPPEKRQRVIARELLIALLVLFVFLFTGPHLLKILQVSESSLRIAGGIILFLIAIKMIFGQTEELLQGTPDGEPFIVPLAIPAIAGPSAVATILLIVGQEPARWPEWALSLFLAWVSSAIILLLSSKLDRIFGDKGLNAIERLMGLVLTTVSVEMLLQGLRLFFDNNKV
ncbi:MAG: NAAT family transporter [Deltaproteobacteria bacterium]|nr:NAAT family transporter [Deltaproteobacteria bacterium]